jgi:hypothetical protein
MFDWNDNRNVNTWLLLLLLILFYLEWVPTGIFTKSRLRLNDYPEKQEGEGGDLNEVPPNP